MAYLDNFHHAITGPAENSSEAPKLVFLHGVMGFSSNFRRIAKAFESTFQVLVYDQRGHGRSFHPDEAEAVNYAPENFANDLDEILTELAWPKITLVGHSMGGRAALNFAARFPERLTRLVIEDIGPNLQDSRSSTVLKIINTVPVPFASRVEAKAWFDHDFFELFKEVSQPQGLAAYLYANIMENDAKQAVWRFSVKAVREAMENGQRVERWEEIRSLKIPTLLVRGEKSTDLPRDIYEQVLKANPVIQGVEIANAGHWVHSDQPEAFIAVLRTFFGL